MSMTKDVALHEHNMKVSQALQVYVDNLYTMEGRPIVCPRCGGKAKAVDGCYCDIIDDELIESTITVEICNECDYKREY